MSNEHIRCPNCQHCTGFSREVLPLGVTTVHCVACACRFEIEPSPLDRFWRWLGGRRT
jgi:hypothetical protein